MRVAEVFLLALLALGASFLLPHAQGQATTNTYALTLAVGEAGQVRLPVNPSTGCSWWVESAPSGVDVSTSDDFDPTVDCGQPPRPGCSNQVAVYTFKPSRAGQYTIELRYGHAWARNEYYQVAIVHLTVGNSQLSGQVLSGKVGSVEGTCGPMSCVSEPLTETNRVCPAICMLSYRVELVVHLGPPGSLSPDRLYRIYITGEDAGEMRAARLKAGDEISILAHPAGYCACGAAECAGGDCWLAGDSDWRYVHNSASSTAITCTCIDQCGDGICQEAVCLACNICPCAESPQTCPSDCHPMTSSTYPSTTTRTPTVTYTTTVTRTVTATSTMTTVAPWLGISGFPTESILAGLAVGVFVLVVLRRRSRYSAVKNGSRFYQPVRK